MQVNIIIRRVNMKRLTIKEASIESGLSESEIRNGIKAGKYPALPIGVGKKKIQYLIDMEQFDKRILEISLQSVQNTTNLISPFEPLRRAG